MPKDFIKKNNPRLSQLVLAQRHRIALRTSWQGNSLLLREAQAEISSTRQEEEEETKRIPDRILHLTVGFSHHTHRLFKNYPLLPLCRKADKPRTFRPPTAHQGRK